MSRQNSAAKYVKGYDMTDKQRICTISDVSLFLILLAVFSAGSLYADQNSKYLDAVRTFADRVLLSGRDIYGPKTTPLFVDRLQAVTLEPVKW